MKNTIKFYLFVLLVILISACDFTKAESQEEPARKFLVGISPYQDKTTLEKCLSLIKDTIFKNMRAEDSMEVFDTKNLDLIAEIKFGKNTASNDRLKTKVVGKAWNQLLLYARFLRPEKTNGRLNMASII